MIISKSEKAQTKQGQGQSKKGGIVLIGDKPKK
jgi:hypothetical protein